MTSDFDDIGQLWRAQPAESDRPQLDAIRARAKRFDRKTRRWRSVGAVALAVVLVANSVEAIWPGVDVIERSGALLTIAAVLYVAFEFRNYARLDPARSGLTSCIEFYRAQLVHERNLAAQGRRFLLPFVPGVTLGLLGGVLDPALPISRRIAVVAAGVALFASVAWLNARTARKLQQDIDALDAM